MCTLPYLDIMVVRTNGNALLCQDIGGLYGKVATNVFFIPLCVLGICVAIYMAQKRTLMAIVKAGAADESGLGTLKVRLNHNLCLAVFLVYPTITSTLFRVLQCKSVGDQEFHEDDYVRYTGVRRLPLLKVA